MASTKIGKVSITLEGEYSSNKDYVRLDVVTYQGSSYVCKKACKGIAVSNTEYWQQIAQKGDKGDRGEQGIQGIQGIQGEKGEKGDRGEQGIQGVQGETGEQGIQGIQGIQGEKGDKGDKGDSYTITENDYEQIAEIVKVQFTDGNEVDY